MRVSMLPASDPFQRKIKLFLALNVILSICQYYRFHRRCHFGESRNPGFPVKTGTQSLKWFPTSIGTMRGCPRIKYGAGSSSPA
jgi:hypothetical protein